MSAPPPSQKDGQQVLKYAFDDATGSLRTNATLVADSVTLNIDAADDSIAIGDQSNGHLMKVNSDGSINVVIPTPVPITATSLPLPTGASTEAKQDVGNTSLASIDSKLTSPLIVTGPLTDAELRASAVPISGSVSVSGTVSATQGTVPWVVSGTVTANAGTNLNTSALALDSTVAKDASLTTINTSVNTLLKPASTLAAVTTVGTITNPVAATQSGTWNITNVSGTVSLPTGASTLVAQTTGNTSLASIDTKTPALGQAVMASSSPVVIASNQSAVPVLVSDQTKATYSASTTFIAAATATDVFTLTGSATKTIKIRSVDFSGVNTGNTNLLVVFLKRSAANSGGTFSTLTAVSHNSGDAAATATARSYTANPSLGALVGNISNDYIFLPTLASTNAAIHSTFNVADAETKPITLLSTSEVFSINLNGALVAGTTTISADITWTEE